MVSLLQKLDKSVENGNNVVKAPVKPTTGALVSGGGI
jgi:hypothetical protein